MQDLDRPLHERQHRSTARSGRGTAMALRLLIADDDPGDARLIAFAMKRAGYAVDEP